MQTVTEAVNHVPGAPVVKGVVDGVLDTVGVMSPHARRVAAYAGAGLLGVAGLVEWPVAAAGAAVVWLTQPRPEHNGGATAQQTGRPAAAARPKAKTASERTATKRGTAAKKRTTAKKTTPKKKSTPKRTASATRTRRTSSSATSRQKS
ncbi:MULTISPECIES: hypothetical protein [Streptomyces]|uniref:Uncharacterized protein n=1 Tax=Streptomyces silvisoli TaxID=3034235 RepID=A0ABT5ZDG6_9ACTN|nr:MULTISPECIES: hypothetical protein [Streptomyces]MDF3287870.1 hypothetical protein [Streptomyces silvisoli]